MSEPSTFDALSALSRRLEELAAVPSGAVVGVRSHGRLAASGIVWKPGVVVTASDAIESDDDLSVVTPDKPLGARLAGQDPATGIAVLRVSEGLPEPQNLAVGAGARVGQMVLALGRGEEGIVASLGMVSVAGGTWQSRRGGRIDRLIRLDMRLGAQSEGGIVVDSAGATLGMVLLGPRRRPLVIPAATIERVAPKLLADGRIARGYLGVGLHSIRLDDALAAVHALADRRASMVVSVDPDGPAREAGILIGDVIVELDGAPLPGPRSLLAKLTPESVGNVAQLKLLRAGQIATARVAIGARPAP
ncbi:MAG TPA: trypsin-like peptidase domain-containing protein [Hyphomicrobiaceae bacterium]|jgi:S1-C subfamily serine protease|nr:trypsin-like peptidase domain-containing protein [Hyphomicrobiaceae bacterium]